MATIERSAMTSQHDDEDDVPPGTMTGVVWALVFVSPFWALALGIGLLILL
jgi:hypothetical protein